MSGWDQAEIFYSDPLTSQGDADNQRLRLQREFQGFLDEYREGNAYIYRDQLARHYRQNQYCLQVDLDHLSGYRDSLVEAIRKNPVETLTLFERAAKEVTRKIVTTGTEATEGETIHDIQSAQMSQLIKVPGIIVSASPTRAKATELTIQCRNCRETKKWPVKPGFGGAQLPRTCDRTPVAEGDQRCPLDPFLIVADKSRCVDQQILKIQELPEFVPTGEMPRHLLLIADRYLTDRVIPGTRCTVSGVYTVQSGKKERGTSTVAVRRPYIQVFGIQVDSAGSSQSQQGFDDATEERIRNLAREPDVYKKIISSTAPSIFGSEDIKKAVACLLFGGSTKVLPDGMRLRGDINVLLLGDPGTAKSQILKFAEQVSPIGVYTSGKGSSAAGLTASVIRDASSREFYLEGGAMVLADGGIVCIDEFDKMRESDRVAIHEAMEQQTISIAKAGITTTLNSRASVLAAANSVFGRWDDTKEADENIEFQSTILSRFDLIFVVKDEYNEERDKRLARHVLGVHLNATERTQEGELDVPLYKKYIQYARRHCGPRLSPSAAEKLKNHFVQLRQKANLQFQETAKRAAIPLTVRQLEALVRISESLAKMKLEPFVTEEDVDEAFRLFQVSTMSAALAGHGTENNTDQASMEQLLTIERQIKQRFPVGSKVSEQRIVDHMSRRNFSEAMIRKVLGIMLRRGELEHKMQRRVLYRVR
ncbi:uncharacterized protein MONBRDRAFT_27771 [Monosiga brevicollis MX1]|uniref:DNA replication licensing factor MCM5 n=1 Tax=Monosiga brevicollis TaxID=81824 RepID=A9V696_MONBE|nr:uncharacterized protein MONBRDRAFT_27771 [Monosiga brevicollis MX1]EDQ87030.1 predicted protein [Monosiga brevicollis MX1]|eukprot:XP_001748269.1 hypothetical protein [Monosiga brevicollis MX1]